MVTIVIPSAARNLQLPWRELPIPRCARNDSRTWGALFAIALSAVLPNAASAQAPRALLPIDYQSSANVGWLQKPVRASRVLDDMTQPATWRFTGTGRLTFPTEPRRDDMRVLRVDMEMFVDAPAPTSNKLSSVNLRRAFDGEDWRAYNRISMWIKPEVSGIPAVPLQIVMHNDGSEKVPDRYGREGIHYVTLAKDGGWQQIVWEIDPLARDRVTMLEIGYWVNKMFAAPTDRVAFEIGRLELQRVEPDHHTGWDVASGRISFSHTGYQTGSSKTAVASDLTATAFDLIRVNGAALGDIVLHKSVEPVRTRLGAFQQMDFSGVNTPGTYVIRAGAMTTRPFRIDGDVWKETIWKALNFFYGERCGFAVPGSHDVDHLDWFATHGNQRIVMAGGWHDAGDLSQGVINTGEITYAMFALAERVRALGDSALEARLIEEAKWGLDWVLRVRFPGGYRMGFASHNLWTNNIVGDADDRTREAKNNPNANYIAAAAEAIAARVLKTRDPALAARSLAVAEDDWSYAIVGVEGPSTWHTPAFAATRLELAGIGITASLELYRATGKKKYADKAVELARVIVESQQKRRVGDAFPLAGFFYTGPDRDTLFHQFHRGNDQAPIVALAQLVEVLPNHTDWMRWYSTVAMYAEYQKQAAVTTAPYGVLPAYVYRLGDEMKEVPDSGALHGATRDQYRAQVQAGMPMGGDWYLRAFPVWFARRGNYGVLLSQAKGLATAARLRGDSVGLDLAQRQAQWVVGRNPFVQSTMYGEGYDWEQQYSVSAGDFVGSLPVGMQSRGVTDLPYWPTQNMYVYKEVWVHSTGRWLWLMSDLLGGVPSPVPLDSTFTVRATTAANGEVTIRLTSIGSGVHAVELRAEHLVVDRPVRTVSSRGGAPVTVEWKGRSRTAGVPWVAVVVPDGDVSRRREVLDVEARRP